MAKNETKSPSADAVAASDFISRQPVRSMTGYGRVEFSDELGRVTVEIRGVNGRYLKLNAKLPSRYAGLEDLIKKLLEHLGVRRGTLDVGIYFGEAAEECAFGINLATLNEYMRQVRALPQELMKNNELRLETLLALPGVVTRCEQTADLDIVWKRIAPYVEKAVRAFNEMRDKEGSALRSDLLTRLALLRSHRSAIFEKAPIAFKDAVEKLRERVQKRMEELKFESLQTDTLEREIILLTDRMDISEELTRLESHFAQMEQTLAQGGEMGKKLDFLTQELFREVNTIGSKAADETVRYHVVDMKSEIEKIREQLQNLE